MQITYQIFESPIGYLLVAGTSYAVTHVAHGTDRTLLGSNFMMEHDDVSAMGNKDYLRQACTAISEYLAGKTRSIDVAVQLEGTEFQRKVWQLLRQIPYGETTSYSDIAQAMGTPDAFRAVANACGDNPVPLIIPCHRVIHKNGDVSGFAWGKEAKHFLLDLEKKHAVQGAAQIA